MKKETLRKLRSLPPTKEMIEKAKDNTIREKIKGCSYYYGDRYYTRRYKYFLRVQSLSGFIKIVIYVSENLAKGIKTPEYEVFLNPSGEEYITRLFDKKGNETGWSSAMLYNLPGMGWYSFHSETYKHSFWINRDATRTLKSLIKDDHDDPISILRKWQQSIKDKEREAKEAKECAPWDADMALVPKEPKDFDEWLKYTVPKVEYGIYKGGAKTTFCTHCEAEVELKGPRIAYRSKDLPKCPKCHRELNLLQGERYKNNFTEPNETTQLIQPIKDGYVIREFFSFRAIWPKTRTVKIFKQETRRVLWKNGELKTYAWLLYKNKYERWVKVDNRTYWWDHKIQVYKRNVASLEKTVLKVTALPIAIKQGLQIPIEQYIFAEQGNPIIEKLEKVHLPRLAEDFIKSSYSYAKDLINQDATELTKMIKLDKMRLKRLQGFKDANVILLRWLQAEKKEDTVWPDETIQFFTELDEAPDTILCIKPQKMGLVELRNYIEKQAFKANKRVKNHKEFMRACEDTLGTYRDYMNMARKLKMRTNLEQIYKPKDLTEAHDNAVELMNQGKMKETANEIKKRFKKVEANLKELTKYEYADGNYKIVAPKSILDIVREGTILHHCIHTCDYYFERIQTKESFILFLRRADSEESPWYTLEIEPGGNIRQKRTTGDKQGPELEAAMPFLKKYQKQLQKKLTREDKKLAKAADEKRKTNYKDIREKNKRVWHGIHQGELLADVLEADFMAAI